MSYLYLTDSSAKLGISGNYLTVKIGSEIIEKIPIETLKNVSIYGKGQVTCYGKTSFVATKDIIIM